MQKVIHLDNREFCGGYNDFPPNFRPLTEEEFVKLPALSYSIKYIDNRQMYKKETDRPELPNRVDARLFFINESEGYAIETDYRNGKVSYYAFGCEHKWHEMSSKECQTEGILHWGRCWHVYKCNICGSRQSVDSSD